jgi:hypothetical protein
MEGLIAPGLRLVASLVSRAPSALTVSVDIPEAFWIAASTVLLIGFLAGIIVGSLGTFALLCWFGKKPSAASPSTPPGWQEPRSLAEELLGPRNPRRPVLEDRRRARID